METDPVIQIVIAVVCVAILIGGIMFWFRFYRMMDDVRRIADALAPQSRRKAPEELRREHLYREFRDDGATKAKH